MVHFIFGHPTIVGEIYHFFNFYFIFLFDHQTLRAETYVFTPVCLLQDVLQVDSKEIIQTTDTEAF